MIKYHEIGETGIKIPPIIFGTSALGNLYRALPDETKLEIIDEYFRQLQSTPVVFDSAGKYGAGLALEALGKCLHKLNISPEKVIISNKLGWLRTKLTGPEPTFEKDIWKDLKYDAVQHISYNGIRRCWNQGIELLGETYMPQLLSVHDPDEYLNEAKDKNEQKKRFQDILDAYRALSEIKSQGDSFAVGIGAKDWRTIERISKYVELDWVMFANSLTIYTHPQELVDFITELHLRKISIINSAVFNAGFLIGSDYFDYRFIDPKNPENKGLFEWRKSFFELCREYEVKPSHACIHFGRSHPGVIALSLNTSNPKHIATNIQEIQTDVPREFYHVMKRKGLIDERYKFV